MPQFIRDDEGYQAWVEEHQPEGWVVNSDEKPNPGYLKLHRTTCKFISNFTWPRHYTTSGFIKTCSTDLAVLEVWADGHGGRLQPCFFCCRDLRPG